MGGASDKISGNAKQAAGKATDDKSLEAKGKLEEARGNVKDKLDDAGEKISVKAGRGKKK